MRKMEKMKRIVTFLCIILLLNTANGQTCEQREKELLNTIGGFSAGLLYNTFGLIGSISDGFIHDAYDEGTVSDLLNAQNKLLDHMANTMENLVKGQYLTDSVDIRYAGSAALVLKGLKKQSELLMDYAKTKSKPKSDAYEAQRTRNWKEISKLMGLKD